MAVTVQTVIKNNGRGSRSIIVAKGKMCSLRAGETKVLDYDIWSYLSTPMKRKIEQDMDRGIISINTRVVTDKSNLTVNADGSFLVQNGGLEELKASDNVVTEKSKLKVDTKPKTTFDIEKGTLANKSVNIMESRLGAKATAVGETIEDAPKMNKQGFTTDKVEASSVFKKNTDTTPANVSNLMPKAVPEPAKAETKEPEAKEETTEDTMSKQQYIDELYAVKDYVAIAGALNEWFPGYSFTKTNIKKCNSYAELKEKYSMLP